jgi:hypothetical protein
MDKLEVHRAGCGTRRSRSFVMKGDAVLIQRRALGKYHTPGLWANTCCTHPHWGEDDLDLRLPPPVARSWASTGSRPGYGSTFPSILTASSGRSRGCDRVVGVTKPLRSL